MQIYAREKVGHLWFVDPRKRTLEVFKLAAGVWVPIRSLKDDAVVAAEPFDAVPFPFSATVAEKVERTALRGQKDGCCCVKQ